MPAVPWEWTNPVSGISLTGRWRPRVQKWTGILIVQVEFTGVHKSMFSGKVSGPKKTWWRDATISDLMMLKLMAENQINEAVDVAPVLEGAEAA